MNDTQSHQEFSPGDHTNPAADPIAELAGVDPAHAPEVAESYAATLERELEESEVPPREPQQLRADLDA